MAAHRRYLVGLIFWLSLTAQSLELVVVVGHRSVLESINRDQLVNIYLGRYRQLPSGALAMPLDYPVASAERIQFYRRLVDKDEAEINAYWARLVFSGNTQPPRTVISTEEMLARVAENPQAIGYIDRSRVDQRFRIIYELRADGNEHHRTK